MILPATPILDLAHAISSNSISGWTATADVFRFVKPPLKLTENVRGHDVFIFRLRAIHPMII